MSKAEAFVIPAGLVIEQTGDGLSIEHDGDIVLHGTLGQPLHRIRSNSGDVELHIDAEVAELSAAGRLVLGGDVTAKTLEADRLEAHGAVRAEELRSGAGGALIEGAASVSTLASRGDVEIRGDLMAEQVEVQDGNLQLHGGVQAQKVTVMGGDLTVAGGLTATEVRADGALQANGDVKADAMSAQDIHLQGQTNNVKVVDGARRIVVGAGRIRSDILIAPTVDLSEESTGKITVIESHNELARSRVKGCLRLADLEEFGLDGGKYLEDRGLSPLSAEEEDAGYEDEATAPPPAPVPPPIQVAPEETPTVTYEDDDEDDMADFDMDAAVEAELQAAAQDERSNNGATPVEPELDLDNSELLFDIDSDSIDSDSIDSDSIGSGSTATEAEMSLDPDAELILPEDELADLDAVDDQDTLTPAAKMSFESNDTSTSEDAFELELAENASNDPDPIYTKMMDTVQRIEACYEGSELPPAVSQLHELVQDRDYLGIRDDITNIWNRLLKFHQKRGLRIQPQVTTTFNTINTIVRKL
ncbi:MAG: hypothetical protein AAFV53_30215 [Myxococcota bacterium]